MFLFRYFQSRCLGFVRWFACSVTEGVSFQVGVHSHPSRAAGTTDAHRRAFLRWRSFASSKDEIQVFPARTEHVALYLQHVLDTTQSPSAVDSAIYGIQWAHNLAGIPSPTDSPIVNSISRAAKKLIGTRLVNKKEPISAEMIRKLVEASDLDNLLELRNVCIFLLAFAGFFRIEEVLHIKYGDIHFHNGYVAINLDISKADQLRKGNQVVISEGSNDYTCPVKIFKRYLCQLERFPVDATHYVFRALSKTKSGHSLDFIPVLEIILRLALRILFPILHCLVLIL